MASTRTAAQSRKQALTQASVPQSTVSQSAMPQPNTVMSVQATTATPVKGQGRGSGRLTLMRKPASGRQGQPPNPADQNVKMVIIGPRQAVISHIKTLHHLRYAHAQEWSRLQRGPKPGEFMSILIVRSAQVWRP